MEISPNFKRARKRNVESRGKAIVIPKLELGAEVGKEEKRLSEVLGEVKIGDGSARNENAQRLIQLIDSKVT